MASKFIKKHKPKAPTYAVFGATLSLAEVDTILRGCQLNREERNYKLSEKIARLLVEARKKALHRQKVLNAKYGEGVKKRMGVLFVGSGRYWQEIRIVTVLALTATERTLKYSVPAQYMTTVSSIFVTCGQALTALGTKGRCKVCGERVEALTLYLSGGVCAKKKCVASFLKPSP
jgi:hypothetical protein